MPENPSTTPKSDPGAAISDVGAPEVPGDPGGDRLGGDHPAVPPTLLESAVFAPGVRTALPAPGGSDSPWPIGSPARSAAEQARPQRIPPRSALVAVPGGLLPAIGVAGLAAAVFVPLDRPGLGWLLAGLSMAGAAYAVDRSARRAVATGEDADTAADAGETSANSAAAAPIRRGDLGTAADAARKPVTDASDTVGGLDAASVPDEDEAAESGERPSKYGARRRVWWGGLALALLAVGAVRDAPWLFALCVVAAVVVGSLAVVRPSAYGLWFDGLAVPFAALTSVPWVYRAAVALRGRGRAGSARVWWSVAVAAALLVAVVPLLAGADAVFAGLVDGLLPRVDVPAVVRWASVFVVAAMGTAGALYLLAGPPPAAGDSDAEPGSVAGDGVDPLGWMGIRRFAPVEWGIPVGALTVVFAAFVGTQVAVLFGGDGYVQRTAGLTYAEYARGGFWQLSIVSMLTLAVIGAVLRYARRESGRERRWLRGAVALVCVLTLLIVASALHRMWTYQQAYGFTVLRLLVEVFEGWIALVYLLVMASLVRLRRGWVPRAAVGAAAVTLLGLAVLNPEGLVADRNIDRWQAGKRLDTGYLSGLSADVLPATDRLPDPERAAIADAVRARLSGDSWRSWNYARATASR
ncbi:DUF4153 domain-containing protein [Nocardia seriolae]|uniref:DUF4173 domain-containing protein n=1 Tax=Nocardia seriolae TaxID=37332 RepID=A0ABC9YR62_9NOCA|nr:DUF4173 domain-containing protein [Nocardia seriolae]APA99022.1 hypothetical protein NS506_04976 [Nocardia seriolae]WKY55596.1 DUF4173 domain-containing protein [Nocardia seriolae]WNJ62550.1 DUF4153 domain-containing protein [Nocardia seriolae]BAW07431.1 conserved hypothetical protein [Nocardia seriolae]BEK88815.1 hypothetical protein NSERKGN1266_47660 [Nocardia seriolae]